MRMSVSGGGDTVSVERYMPRMSAGTSTTNPAMGPAMPTSKSTLREGNASRMRMTAPSVPI